MGSSRFTPFYEKKLLFARMKIQSIVNVKKMKDILTLNSKTNLFMEEETSVNVQIISALFAFV
jgi:hypothetical protein